MAIAALVSPFSFSPSSFFFIELTYNHLGRIGSYQQGNCNSAIVVARSSTSIASPTFCIRSILYAANCEYRISEDIRSTINFIYTSFLLLLFFFFNQLRDHNAGFQTTRLSLRLSRGICVWWKLSSNQIHPVSALNPDNC